MEPGGLKRPQIKTDGSPWQIYRATEILLEMGYSHGGSGWSKRVIKAGSEKLPPDFFWKNPFININDGIEYSSGLHSDPDFKTIKFKDLVDAFQIAPAPSFDGLF